ncbi:hypothetical protein JCM9743_10580 [Natrinema sp. JCM 9743]
MGFQSCCVAFMGCGGVYSDESRSSGLPVGTDPCRPWSRRPALSPIRRDTRPGIIEPRGANANKGHRPFTLNAGSRTEKALLYARYKGSYPSKRAFEKSIDKSYQPQFSRVRRQSALKQGLIRPGTGRKS